MDEASGVTILHFDTIDNTPALPVAVDAWRALIKAGHCPNIVLLEGDHSALLAVRPDQAPLGIITYVKHKRRKTIEVWLGFVYPEYRRIGIYHGLWDELVRTASTEGVIEIDSSTNSTNEAMRAVAKAQGRTESSVALRFVL